MTFVSRSVPREADDPPPALPTEIETLAAERAALLVKVRPRVRSLRQERIRERITDITRQILSGRREP